MKRASSFKKISLLVIFVVAVTGVVAQSFLTIEKKVSLRMPQAYAEEATDFKWIPRRPGITRAQIALGRAVTLPFEFTIKGNVQKVRFEIPKKFSDLGIDVADDEVAVKDGKARSAVIFTVPPGKPLGRFELSVIAKDSKTGKELGKGTIPFMLLPPGVGGC